MHLSGAAPIVPNSDEEEDGDRQMDADDLRDYLEQDIVPLQLPPATGPYASYLALMPDWINMTQRRVQQVLGSASITCSRASPVTTWHIT